MGLLWAHMGIARSVLMRMHMNGMTAMGPQAISGRFETFWHADGLNVQPERSERFKTGLRRFVLETMGGMAGIQSRLTASMRRQEKKSPEWKEL